MKLVRINPETCLDIYAEKIWNGYEEGYLYQVLICIRHGRIAAIKPWASEENSTGMQLRLPGLTVLPGLVDSHVHLALDGKDFDASLKRWHEPLAMETEISLALEESLRHGLVAVRDGGDRESYNLRAREWVAAGKYPGPQVIATGKAVTKKGYYGSFLGPGFSDETSLLDSIASQARNVDQVKIVVSGIVTFRRFGETGKIQLSEEELLKAVNLAHYYKKHVMAHVNSNEGISLALSTGVDTIEHGYFISRDQLKIMAVKDIYWVPTIAAVANRLNTVKKEEYTPVELDIIKRTYERQMEMIAVAYKEGVKLAVGTDAGAPGVYHGKSYVDELKYWYQAGIPAKAILKAATSTAASALGIGEEIGQIKPGYRPCLVAVKGDPLEDLKTLRHPEAVIWV